MPQKIETYIDVMIKNILDMKINPVFIFMDFFSQSEWVLPVDQENSK